MRIAAEFPRRLRVRNGTHRCLPIVPNMRNLLLAPILLLAACSDRAAPPGTTDRAAQAPAAIDLSLSSPDQAVKTWWKIRDVAEVDDQNRCLRQVSELSERKSFKYAKSVSTSAALASLEPETYVCDRATYSRDIVEVKVESETRAVVLARIKPSTPIPPGVVLTTDQSKDREKGEQYKYVFEKIGSEWKLAQMYRLASYGDNPWEPIFEETRTRIPHYYVVGPQ